MYSDFSIMLFIVMFSFYQGLDLRVNKLQKLFIKIKGAIFTLPFLNSEFVAIGVGLI